MATSRRGTGRGDAGPSGIGQSSIGRSSTGPGGTGKASAGPSTGTSSIAQPLARYSAWRRAGDLVFLSGVIAVDPARGVIVSGYADIPADARALLGQTGEFSTDMKEGPILAQSWFVLNSIRATVEAAGGQMNDVFKLVQYFRNLDHFPLYSRVRKLFFTGEPPASTVVEVSAMLPSAAILIEVEATAHVPLNSPAKRV